MSRFENPICQYLLIPRNFGVIQDDSIFTLESGDFAKSASLSLCYSHASRTDDVLVSLRGYASLIFRAPFLGSGSSPLTHGALKLLSYAIHLYRDFPNRQFQGLRKGSLTYKYLTGEKTIRGTPDIKQTRLQDDHDGKYNGFLVVEEKEQKILISIQDIEIEEVYKREGKTPPPPFVFDLTLNDPASKIIINALQILRIAMQLDNKYHRQITTAEEGSKYNSFGIRIKD